MLAVREFFRDRERRAIAAPPIVAAISLVLMLVCAITLGLPIRDPDAKYVSSPLAVIGLIVLAFMFIDVLPRAYSAWRLTEQGLLASITGVLKERWGNKRGLVVIGALVSFYVTYIAYRNLKSYLPFIRGDEQDGFLLEFDRFLFFGNDPGPILHNLLGTGASAHVLSFAYVAFLTFVPVSLGAALVWSTKLRPGLWYVTALCTCWLLGAVSYYLIPSLGPIYAQPGLFSELPATGVSQLQSSLMENRLEVLYDPHTSGAVQSVAAFASLHVGVVFAAALIAHLCHLARLIRVALWSFLVLTVLATIYFGWHYLIDDLAGFVLGFAAVYISAWATGHHWRPFAGRSSSVPRSPAGAH